jgi:lysophospholipase L1-like esterase
MISRPTTAIALSLVFFLCYGPELRAQNSATSVASPSVPQEPSPDWAGLQRYQSANEELLTRALDKERIIFFGDSITEAWNLDLSFPGKGYINRGIGGQTTGQMLLRFRQDVVTLKPKVVVILAGTNDVAENQGPTTLGGIEDNLASMVDIAEANHIRVVLSSILPVAAYPWRKEIQPVEKIAALNSWMKGYAAGRGVVFLDYFSTMQDERHGLKAELSEDGVHPNKVGYAMMAPLAERAISEALQTPAP